MRSSFSLSLSVLLLWWPGCGAAGSINCKGCTPLDAFTFDKMVSRFGASLVKVDAAYPYGDRHEEFSKLAAEAAKLEDLLVADVGVKDYGEKDNQVIVDRYGLAKEDFPAVLLFRGGDDEGGEDAGGPVKFDGSDFTVETLKIFLRQQTGMYLPVKGCFEKLDRLADRMLRAAEDGDRAEQDAVIREAEKVAAKATKKRQKAELYVKVMRKVAAGETGFAAKEAARAKKLMKEQMTEAKRADLAERVNIFRSLTDQEDREWRRTTRQG